jgi:hypothetical protein
MCACRVSSRCLCSFGLEGKSPLHVQHMIYPGGTRFVAFHGRVLLLVHEEASPSARGLGFPAPALLRWLRPPRGVAVAGAQAASARLRSILRWTFLR